MDTLMDMLKNYIILIVCAIIFFTIVRMLLPENSLKKYANLVMGFLLIIVVISPVVKLLTSETIEGNMDKIGNEIFKSRVDNRFNEYIKEDSELTNSIFKDRLSYNIKENLEAKFEELDFEVLTDAKVEGEKVIINDVLIKYVRRSGVRKIEKVVIGKDSSKKELNEIELEIQKYIANIVDISAKKISIVEG